MNYHDLIQIVTVVKQELLSVLKVFIRIFKKCTRKALFLLLISIYQTYTTMHQDVQFAIFADFLACLLQLCKEERRKLLKTVSMVQTV